MITRILLALAIAFGVIAAPALSVASVITEENEQQEWAEFHSLAKSEYLEMFDDVWSRVEVKRSKNNRVMVKGANATSFKFVSVK